MAETSIFALPVLDVLFPLVFSRLDVIQIWMMRGVCRRVKCLCEKYFRVAQGLYINPEQSVAVGPILQMLRICDNLKQFCLTGKRSGLRMPTLGRTDHDAILLALDSSPASLQQLRVLSLSQLELGRPQESLGGLAVRCSSLSELHISGVSKFDDNLLECLTHGCCRLERVTLRHTAIRGKPLPSLLARCPDLRHLCVSHSFYVDPSYLEEALKHCPRLQCVDLTHMEAVGDRVVLVLGEWCRELRRMSVEGCSRVSGRMLAPLRQRGVELDVSVELHQLSNAYRRVPAQI